MLGIAIILIVYMIPTFVAFGKTNFGAVLFLNLFLGWTVVGWLVAFVMAASGKSVADADRQRKAEEAMIQLAESKASAPAAGA